MAINRDLISLLNKPTITKYVANAYIIPLAPMCISGRAKIQTKTLGIIYEA